MSEFVKELRYGKVQCRTARTSDSNTETGWQIDGSDPYRQISFVRFSQGNTLTMQDDDSPRIGLAVPNFMHGADAYYLNQVFETYLVYFTGPNPSVPIFQRAIGLQGSPKPVARISWSWGGQGIYKDDAPHAYLLQFSLVPPRTYVAQAVDAMRPYTGNADNLTYQQCPSGPAVSNNPIDGNRYFVMQQYCDILGRQPDAAWLHWISQLTQCVFDQACIDSRRVAIARGFYESAEFRAAHPALQNPGAPAYNEEYVKQLYRTLLRREPGALYQNWVNTLNQTGDYSGIVFGFLYSSEYRNRFNPGYTQCFQF